MLCHFGRGYSSLLNTRVFSSLTAETRPGSWKLGAWDHHRLPGPASISQGLCQNPTARCGGAGLVVPARDTQPNFVLLSSRSPGGLQLAPNFSSETHSVLQKTRICGKGMHFNIRAGMMNPTLRFVGAEI